MQIKLRFFASVREALGMSEEVALLPDSVQTIGDVRNCLIARGDVWAETLGTQRAVRMAVNQVMGKAESAVQDGDEVAFFPPVTGG